MSMTEFKNMKARCLDMNSDDRVVLHEVSYEVKDSDVWVAKIMQVRATDPMDAIDYVKNQGETK